LTPSNPTRRFLEELGAEGDHPPSDTCDVRVLDFSPYSHDRPLAAEADDDRVQVTLHRAPTVLSKRRIWKEDVATRLAYQEVVAKWKVRANGIMIDEERLIVIAVSPRTSAELN
jgi:hypothetical protein